MFPTPPEMPTMEPTRAQPTPMDKSRVEQPLMESAVTLLCRIWDWFRPTAHGPCRYGSTPPAPLRKRSLQATPTIHPQPKVMRSAYWQGLLLQDISTLLRTGRLSATPS